MIFSKHLPLYGKFCQSIVTSKAPNSPFIAKLSNSTTDVMNLQAIKKAVTRR